MLGFKPASSCAGTRTATSLPSTWPKGWCSKPRPRRL